VREIVKQAILASAPPGVRVEVEAAGDVPAVVLSRDHPAAQAAGRAMHAGFGTAPVFIGTGGSIGPVASFERVLKIPQVMIGVGLPDDHIHAPNEKFDLSQLFGGIVTMTALYDELAELAHA
jgi:acetylornithine deacetylase/succinyl-diaminopimelate desuccinylase-like protein